MEYQHYPALFRAADRASAAAQLHHLTSIKLYSLLMILAAGLSVYGIESKNAAVLAAILIIASIFVSVFMLLRGHEDTWYRARAVAESVKTSTWRFIMKTEPFTNDSPSDHTLFANRIRRILGEHRELSLELGGKASEQDQITEEMLRIRNSPWEDRVKFYRDSRIDEQRAWYASKSEAKSRQGKLWLVILLACQGFAVLFVILRVGYPSWGYWPSEVFVIAAGSILTWIQANRFRELSAAYAVTAHEVGIIHSELDLVANEREFTQFVADSENAFSREHTQWLARKDGI